MIKKEFPIWFKVETILFLFFSVSIALSYFQKASISGDSNHLLSKLLIAISLLLVVWFFSLIVCCRRK